MDKPQSEISTAERILKIDAELEKIEKKLLTPKRTVKDLVRHMQLLKELAEI